MRTTYLHEIMDLVLLGEMMDKGYIKQQRHPDDPRWLILNYTDAVVYDRVWNEATRQCRGLIVLCRKPWDLIEARVLARPFPKFFNYGEVNAAKIALDQRVEVLDKVDGSLGILYTGPDGQPAIATRGSFASEQALHATEVYREKYHLQWNPEPECTYLFEIVYPQNRIVLDYGDKDDLVLLGGVGPRGRVFRAPVGVEQDGWRGPVVESFGVMTFGEALALPPRPNAEGLVVCNFAGQMLKVKQDDYVALHKVIFGLNERAVWEGLRDMSVEDFCAGLPDEFHEWVKEVAGRLFERFLAIHEEVFTSYLRVCRATYDGRAEGRERRKAFAAKASKEKYPAMLFMLFDRRVEDVSHSIWDLLRPEHVPFSRSVQEEALAA